MTARLPFANLAARHPGVSAGIGQCFEEAARICLDRHHTPPVLFGIVDNAGHCDAEVDWTVVDAALADARANEIDATEVGAYAIALATVELTRGLIAVRRAETATGADYYVDRPGANPGDLETALRLEISGMSQGTRAALEARLGRKLDQAARGESNLPAVAVVVGFAQRTILCADLRDHDVRQVPPR